MNSASISPSYEGTIMQSYYIRAGFPWRESYTGYDSIANRLSSGRCRNSAQTVIIHRCGIDVLFGDIDCIIFIPGSSEQIAELISCTHRKRTDPPEIALYGTSESFSRVQKEPFGVCVADEATRQVRKAGVPGFQRAEASGDMQRLDLIMLAIWQEDWVFRSAVASSLIFRHRTESIEEKFHQIPRTLLGITKTILSWCSASFRPLSKSELIEVLLLNDNPHRDPSISSELADRCAQNILLATAGLVTFNEDGVVQIVNEETRNYLTNGKSAYSISYSAAEETIAHTCLTYLSLANVTRDIQSKSETRQSASSYMIRHCISHSIRADMRGGSIAGRILDFIQNNLSAFQRWCQIYSALTGVGISDEIMRQPLLFSAKFGYYKLARMLLDREGDPKFGSSTGSAGKTHSMARSVQDGISAEVRRTASEIAFANNHTDIAFMLLFADS